jgi:PAT family acetyl-CoA transporter-like MFS transporter 1
MVGVLVCAVFVYATPYFKDANNDYPAYYYALCLTINVLYTFFAVAMNSALVAFYAKISDKKIGGTYMTYLNTVSNMGQ